MTSRKRTGDEAAGSRPPSGSLPAPDHAWKALSVTNEWIRHADAKTGITLAFAGATAAALFNVTRVSTHWGIWSKIGVTVTLVALLGVVVCAAVELHPRVKLKRRAKAADSDSVSADDAVNLLFFGDIAKHYGSDRPNYRDVLSTLTADSPALTAQIADQIHANAHIATTKFAWVDRAITCEIVAALALALSTFLITKGW